MEDQNHISAKTAVHAFLSSLYDKKTEKEQKQLAKAIEDGDSDGASVLTTTLVEAKEKYQLESWMDKAANKMANQIGFGTHISKGIHSGSKGDNINFDPTTSLPNSLVGHQSIENHKLDASGNAAALPLFSFFNFEVNSSKKIMDYIIENDDDFKYSLSKDANLSELYFNIFRELLVGGNSKPCTSEYNKQLLWPIHQSNYVCVLPLYPSSLTHYVYNKIQHLKYSDEINIAKKNRFNGGLELTSYSTISDLATVNIGGSNPQGVSKHMSKQGGRNYLLPSMPPPMLTRTDTFKPSKFANSIFGSALAHKAKPALSKVFKAVKDQRNIVDIRDARKQAIDEILNYIFESAEHLRSTMPAGWSKDYELDDCEKYWLDPSRAELEGQADFKAQREDSSAAWHQQIIHSFARWLNSLLQDEFKEIGREFADAEHLEWEREIEAMTKLYERAGRGVFL